ncbi:phosphate acyltransferase [Candidatus Poriferisocius sp.]|uniref:phosphate acyltransferase n=1 Tax=Candidatus Poriferisocius sp. TaxID=3101276 RepID=UPI003B597120
MTNPEVVGGRVAVAELWRQQARAARMRVVLADGRDERAAEAAKILEREELAIPVLLDDPAGFCSGAVRAAAETSPWSERIDLGDPLHVGALMVAVGDADACVGGASRSSADVVRAALYCIGLAPGVETISSCFLLVLPDGTPITYGDCGVVPDPDPDELASIAISTATTHEQLAGEKARVAMLSYSTKGSADGSRVERVRTATEIVRQRMPSLAVDGEMQFDAAWDQQVAAAKAPGSDVAGRANVFVFPDLDSGNIAYKITERLAGARAYGPLLQGTAGVVHDLSRGCSADDIATVAVIAACQATKGRP